MDETDGRDQARQALMRAARRCGWPAEFGEALAIYLGSVGAMQRMAAYLVQARPQSMEEAADEAVAIAEQRDAWVERKKGEYYNAKITEFYNRERDE
ncbi:MAG: hypothetical protein MR874_09010 [Coriobacteriaceae bacterium]|nr:hypothetical protein [Coriobacteriaceae bacterium]MDD7584002.1 hypothetical protein [Coriobacteriaceae bacterium]